MKWEKLNNLFLSRGQEIPAVIEMQICFTCSSWWRRLLRSLKHRIPTTAVLNLAHLDVIPFNPPNILRLALLLMPMLTSSGSSSRTWCCCCPVAPAVAAALTLRWSLPPQWVAVTWADLNLCQVEINWVSHQWIFNQSRWHFSQFLGCTIN